jgi:hypothetical protein
MVNRLFLLTLLLLALLTGTLLAHEGREVGDYELTFGWRNEPAYVGFPNGPEVFISFHSDEHGHGDSHGDHSDDEDKLAELEVALQVEVTFGPAARIIDLRPAWGEAGHFIADLIPTRPGDYTFRVFGTIGDVEVDETFSSADGEFSSVEPVDAIQFPEPDPTLAELLARIEALEAEIAALKGE